MRKLTTAVVGRALIFVGLLTSSVLPQSKVGTTGAQFLELPLSARTAGMGDIGTVLMDSRSYHTNPATLGFNSNYRAAIQLDPLVNGLNGSEVDYYSVSGVSKVTTGESGVPTIGIGFRAVGLRSGPMVERTYNHGVDLPDEGIFGTGRTSTWNDTRLGFAVGLGWSGKVDFGIGAGINKIREDVHDYHARTSSFDFGTYLGVPINSRDAAAFRFERIIVGASLCNVGPDIKFIEKEAPLPKTGQIGVGLKFAWRRGNRDLFTLFPAIEYSRLFTDDSFDDWKLGVEISVRELLCLRVGHMSSDEPGDDQVTYGLSFSTVGLRSSSLDGNVGGSGVFGFIFSNVDVQLSFAHQSSIIDDWEGTNYYGIELLF